ncbi:MAG: hypothetical protein ACRCX2_13220 [Paraclostridium sp.]
MEFKLTSIKKDFINECITENTDKIKNEYIKDLIRTILINEAFYSKILTEISEKLLASYETAYVTNESESSPLKVLLYSEDKRNFEMSRLFKNRIVIKMDEENIVAFLEILENQEEQTGYIDFIITEMCEHLTVSISQNEKNIKDTIKDVAEIMVKDLNENLISMLKNEKLITKDKEIFMALLFNVYGAEVIKLNKEYVESIA